MKGDYKYNWDEMNKRLFHINEHRINNTGWMMKWWWNGGVERKAKLLGECWTFLTYIFTPTMEAMSRICACKTDRNLQIFGWCLQFKQSCPWATLSYFYLQNKAGKSTQWGESSQKMLQKSSALSFAWNAKKSLCKLNSLHCRQKTTTYLWKLVRKGNWRKKGIAATG